VAWGLCTERKATMPTRQNAQKKNTPSFGSERQRIAVTSLASPTFVFHLHPSEALKPSRSDRQKSSESLQAVDESEKNSGIGGKADMSPLHTKIVSSPSEAMVSLLSETADSCAPA